MAVKKPKFYVVWQGKTPGIYTSWAEAEQQIKGHPAAKFKSFKTKEEAEFAYKNPIQLKQTSRRKKPCIMWFGRALNQNLYELG